MNENKELEQEVEKMHSGVIKHSSFNLDTGVKAAFKSEVSLNGDDMSSVVNGFMANYVVVSKKKRELNELNK